jgi:hypothetical protein
MTYALSKRGALLLMAAVALLFAFPGMKHARGLGQPDSFPASRFTMFAHKRGDVQKIVYVRGTKASGKQKPVPVRHIWSGGMNSGWMRLLKLSTSPKPVRKSTCANMAERLVTRRPETEMVRIEVVDARYSITDYFRNQDRKPRRERVVAACDVPARRNADP